MTYIKITLTHRDSDIVTITPMTHYINSTKNLKECESQQNVKKKGVIDREKDDN
jgi:hypothetical protein